MSDDPNHQRERSGRREDPERRGPGSWMYIAAAFVSVILLVGGFFVLRGLLRDDPVAAPAGPDTSITASPDAPGAPGSLSCEQARAGFDTPISDTEGVRLDRPKSPDGQLLRQTSPTSLDRQRLDRQPSCLMWQSIRKGAILAVSASDGPAVMTDGVPSGYAHTPQGAVLAAMNFSEVAGTGTADQIRQMITNLVDAPESVRQRALADVPARGGYDLTGMNNAPLAVRVGADYSPDRAYVSLVALRTTEGVYRVQNTTMVWVDGDWKVSWPDYSPGALTDAPGIEGWSRWTP